MIIMRWGLAELEGSRLVGCRRGRGNVDIGQIGTFAKMGVPTSPVCMLILFRNQAWDGQGLCLIEVHNQEVKSEFISRRMFIFFSVIYAPYMIFNATMGL